MNSVSFFVLVVLLAKTASAHEYLGECYYYSGNLTFVCVENERAIKYFTPGTDFTCKNHGYYISRSSIGTINFHDCEQPPVPSNLFQMYTSVHTFNVSYIGLTSLQVDDFEGAKNLVRFIASHNEITEIPSFLFHKTEKLADVDFSFNKIERIDDFAFYSDIHLEKLNLSYNRLTVFNKQILDIHSNLTQFDISWNRISNLRADTFENLRKLMLLDLSGNFIQKLDSNTFTNLAKLQYLNVSYNNLTEVKPGTFSSQTKLQTLDLSNNQIKALDAAIFSTQTIRLKLLMIERNLLRELNGFTSAHFPNVKIFGIDSNQFSCSFLRRFFQMITPKNLGNVSTKLNCSFTELNESSTILPSETSTKVQFSDVNTRSNISKVGLNISTEKLNIIEVKHQPPPQLTPEKSPTLQLPKPVPQPALPQPLSPQPQHNINNTIQHYNNTVIKVYSDGDSIKHLHVTTWINTIGLIIVVIALIWIILHKRIHNKNTFANVLYSQDQGESMNTIENHNYGNGSEK